MQNFASLDLTIRSTNAGRPNTEQRLEVRIASTGNYVAGFYTGTRTSNNESRWGMSTDFIRRKELNAKQIEAIESWLREQILANLLHP